MNIVISYYMDDELFASLINSDMHAEALFDGIEDEAVGTSWQNMWFIKDEYSHEVHKKLRLLEGDEFLFNYNKKFIPVSE